MNWSKISVRLYVISFFIIIGLGIAYYFIIGREADLAVTDQVLRRKLTLARAQSSNIVAFFDLYGDSITSLSRLNSIHDKNKDTVSDMDNFVDQWKASGLIGGVSIADETGKITFNSNVTGVRDIGTLIDDRDYFKWAKEQNKEGVFYIGQPIMSRLGTTKGEPIVPIAAPIVDEGVFEGVVISPIKLKSLKEKYLELLRISDKTGVYLIDKQGTVIYSNLNPGIVGQNTEDLVDQNQFLGSNLLIEKLKGIIERQDEGGLVTSLLDQNSGKVKDYYVAYSPIDLKDQKWILVMTTPVEEATPMAASLKSRLKIMILLISLTMFFYGFLVKKEVESVDKEKVPDQNKL